MFCVLCVFACVCVYLCVVEYGYWLSVCLTVFVYVSVCDRQHVCLCVFVCVFEMCVCV